MFSRLSSECRTNRGDEWSVWQANSELVAVARQHAKSTSIGDLSCAADKRRFSDPGFSSDEQRGPRTSSGALDRLLNEGQLGITAHHNGAEKCARQMFAGHRHRSRRICSLLDAGRGWWRDGRTPVDRPRSDRLGYAFEL